MISMLKAPCTRRLKLDYENPLSSFAFSFNLRCYSKAGPHMAETARLVIFTHSNPRFLN